jgi:aryl-alcohol dehydrogenase-like predicted oxidoreductase
MIMRTLGKTGVKVSRLAIGAMPFGGDADEKTAQDLWKTARDAGVNFLDTANVYSNGVSEQICGRLIKGCRNEIVLATKAYFPMHAEHRGIIWCAPSKRACSVCKPIALICSICTASTTSLLSTKPCVRSKI